MRTDRSPSPGVTIAVPGDSSTELVWGSMSLFLPAHWPALAISTSSTFIVDDLLWDEDPIRTVVSMTVPGVTSEFAHYYTLS